MTHQYARDAGFKGRPASIQISGVGTGNKNRSKIQYRVLLRKRDGAVAEFTPYGVEKIIGDALSMSMEKARSNFPVAAGRLESPEGPIHMLIGMDPVKDAPQEQARQEGIMLYKSEFGTGYMACSNMSEVERHKKFVGTESRVSAAEVRYSTLGVHPCRGHGNRTPQKMPCLQELQRMSVSQGQSVVQGEYRV